MSSTRNKIAIIGSGLIGSSFAMVFASGGYNVYLYDSSDSHLRTALERVEAQLKSLESLNLLRGKLSAQEQQNLICGCSNFEETIKDALLIQECIPEKFDLKREMHSKIDALVNDVTVIASSTSTIVPSALSEGLKHKNQFLINHPINPPLFVPLTEVVPAPWTKPEFIETMVSILKKSGQTPVVLKREINGFVVNRVQYAILNEGFNLVKDGIIDPIDFDKVMSEGLGMRYAFIGPFETTHLNAPEGYRQYMEIFSKVMTDVSAGFKPPPKYDDALIEEIGTAMEKHVPLDKLKKRMKWRDDLMTKLWQLKRGKL